MLENINLAFQGVCSHKLRSFLTMLGIIIGIAAIITIVSTIKGTNEQIKQNLIGAGNNVVNVTLMQDNNQMDFSYAPVPQGISMITPEMRDEIDKLDKVKESSLYYSRSWADGVYVGNSSFNGAIYGGDSHFLSVTGYMVNYGRGFIDSDFATCRKVALVDANTAFIHRKAEELLADLTDGMTFAQWIAAFCQRESIRTKNEFKFSIIERNFANFVDWLTDEGRVTIQREYCAKTYYHG